MVDNEQLPELLLGQGLLVGVGEWSLQVDSRPSIPGQLVFKFESSLSSLSERDFTRVWFLLKKLVSHISQHVQPSQQMRYATGTEGGNKIHIYPLVPLNQAWQPIRAGQTTFSDAYPGYLTTKSSPPIDNAVLSEMQLRITEVSGWSKTSASYAFPDAKDDNLFAKLVRGEIPQWRIWETDQHIAFLTPFGNLPGFTVLIPRQHLSSNILALEDGDFIALVQAAHKVSQILKKALNVERVGMFFEGFEIDYAHAKLLPVPTKLAHPVDPVAEYHDKYTGFSTTQPGKQRGLDELQILKGVDGLEEYAASVENEFTRYENGT